MARYGEAPSPQELRVLQAVVEHGTMRHAAEALGLAVATVDMYVDLLRVKSGRRYLPQVIGWAAENGWLAPPRLGRSEAKSETA